MKLSLNSNTSSVTSDVILRAFAITSVVFNHAAALPGRPFELGGGLNILLALSGYSFARFTLTQKNDAALRRSIVQFGWNLLLPCLAIVLLSFFIRREWSLTELLFISNFFQLSHLSFLYTWYPQVILQMMALFYVATYVPGVSAAIREKPFPTAIAVLLISYLAMQVFTLALADLSFADRMVPYSMWNFVLGWVAYFAVHREKPLSLAGRLFIIAVAFLLAAFIFGFDGSYLRTLAVTITMATLLLVQKVKIPSVAAKLFTTLSQATFTIFLFHVFFLRIFEIGHLRQYETGFHIRDVLIAWSVTMIGTVSIWIALSAVARAWRYFVSDHGQVTQLALQPAVGFAGQR